MTISRRKFLEAGILTSIVSGATLRSTALAATHPSQGAESNILATSIDYYNQSTFAAYINSDFRITRGREETWLRLVLVEDFPTRESVTPSECFRLLFSGSVEESLQQGTYQFDHAALGAFPLFIVPGNPADGKRRYEAVFNRLASGTVTPVVNPSPVTHPPGKKRRTEVWEIDTISLPDSSPQRIVERPRRLK